MQIVRLSEQIRKLPSYSGCSQWSGGTGLRKTSAHKTRESLRVINCQGLIMVGAVATPTFSIHKIFSLHTAAVNGQMEEVKKNSRTQLKPKTAQIIQRKT